LHKGVAVPRNVLSLDNIKPMQVDYAQTAQKSEEIKQYLKQWAEQ